MNLFESSKIHAAFIACSKLSISRDDAVKGVLKYEGVNLRKGGDTDFFFMFRLSQFRGPTISEPRKGYNSSFIRYTIKKKSGLLTSCLTSMNRVEKTTTQETNKIQ